MALDKRGDKKEGSLKNIKLMKRYFTGIKETWIDQRKGYSNQAYATYTTKIVPYQRNAELFKHIGAVEAYHKGSKTFVTKSVGRYIANTIKQTSSVSEARFHKDSKGNWK